MLWFSSAQPSGKTKASYENRKKQNRKMRECNGNRTELLSVRCAFV